MRGEYLAAGLSLMLLERLAVERLPFVGGLPVVVEAVLVERGEHVAVRVEGDSVVFGVCLERVLVSEGEPFARLTDEAPALGAVESAAEPHLGAVEAAAFREELPAGLGHVFGHVVVFAPWREHVFEVFLPFGDYRSQKMHGVRSFGLRDCSL